MEQVSNFADVAILLLRDDVTEPWPASQRDKPFVLLAENRCLFYTNKRRVKDGSVNIGHGIEPQYAAYFVIQDPFSSRVRLVHRRMLGGQRWLAQRIAGKEEYDLRWQNTTLRATLVTASLLLQSVVAETRLRQNMTVVHRRMWHMRRAAREEEAEGGPDCNAALLGKANIIEYAGARLRRTRTFAQGDLAGIPVERLVPPPLPKNANEYLRLEYELLLTDDDNDDDDDDDDTNTAYLYIGYGGEWDYISQTQRSSSSTRLFLREGYEWDGRTLSIRAPLPFLSRRRVLLNESDAYVRSGTTWQRPAHVRAPLLHLPTTLSEVRTQGPCTRARPAYDVVSDAYLEPLDGWPYEESFDLARWVEDVFGYRQGVSTPASAELDELLHRGTSLYLDDCRVCSGLDALADGVASFELNRRKIEMRYGITARLQQTDGEDVTVIHVVGDSDWWISRNYVSQFADYVLLAGLQERDMLRFMEQGNAFVEAGSAQLSTAARSYLEKHVRRILEAPDDAPDVVGALDLLSMTPDEEDTENDTLGSVVDRWTLTRRLARRVAKRMAARMVVHRAEHVLKLNSSVPSSQQSQSRKDEPTMLSLTDHEIPLWERDGPVVVLLLDHVKRRTSLVQWPHGSQAALHRTPLHTAWDAVTRGRLTSALASLLEDEDLRTALGGGTDDKPRVVDTMYLHSLAELEAHGPLSDNDVLVLGFMCLLAGPMDGAIRSATRSMRVDNAFCELVKQDTNLNAILVSSTGERVDGYDGDDTPLLVRRLAPDGGSSIVYLLNV